ncbi:hypothetical protein E4U19_001768 [Claviceps sp. Clav32 group G5]|nr:hypothetical protein E4U19_001768 [Claviceps sp. Clav32 group G5]
MSSGQSIGVDWRYGVPAQTLTLKNFKSQQALVQDSSPRSEQRIAKIRGDHKPSPDAKLAGNKIHGRGLHKFTSSGTIQIRMSE